MNKYYSPPRILSVLLVRAFICMYSTFSNHLKIFSHHILERKYCQLVKERIYLVSYQLAYCHSSSCTHFPDKEEFSFSNILGTHSYSAQGMSPTTFGPAIFFQCTVWNNKLFPTYE